MDITQQQDIFIMTKVQAAWAASHDWYLSTYSTGVDTYGIVACGQGSEVKCYFTTYHTLYIWAGY